MANRDKSVFLIITLLISAIAASLISCGNSDAGEQPPKLSEELNIYSRFGFLDPSVIEKFEMEFRVKVNLDIYQNQELMLSVVESNPGKYDLIFPTERLVSQMIQLNLLAELDPRHISNLYNIDSQFLNSPFDPGNRYSVPYLWGTTGIAVNTNYVKDRVNSWGILWDPQYQGRISMLRNPRKAIGITMKYLGYSLNSPDPSEFEKAREKLREQNPLLLGFLDAVEYVEKLKSGELWLAEVWNGDAIALRESMPQIAFVIPREGSDYYMSCMAIPRDAPHKYSAEVFIDFILRPEVHAAMANYNHYACPNKASIDSKLIDSRLLGDPGIYPPPRTKINLESWKTDSGPNNALYNKTWAELQRQ